MPREGNDPYPLTKTTEVAILTTLAEMLTIMGVLVSPVP